MVLTRGAVDSENVNDYNFCCSGQLQIIPIQRKFPDLW